MPGDIASRPIAWVGFSIAAAVVIVVVSVFLLLRAWDAAPDASRVRPPEQPGVAGPTLQSAPQPDLARYRAGKLRQRDTAGWVDPQRGIAHIPVADAMALLAASAASAPRSAEGQP